MSLLWNDFINNLVVIILCAGEGRRMKEYSKEIPKPLLKISSLNNKTILQNTIEILKTLGIKETFVVKGHLGHLIDENIASLDKNITIIDSKEEYKKGPLNSFIEVLKSQNYQNTMSLLNEKGFFLVIPGDTIFESLLLHEILEQARKHQLEFKKIPLVFYRNLNPDLIYNTKKQEINKITKKISIAVIQKNHPSNLLKEIVQVELEEITHKEIVNQIIPIFIFPVVFNKIILKMEPFIQERTLKALINDIIKAGNIINALELKNEYQFYDIDEITDLTRLNQ